jgi:hypothetical protein
MVITKAGVPGERLARLRAVSGSMTDDPTGVGALVAVRPSSPAGDRRLELGWAMLARTVSPLSSRPITLPVAGEEVR